MELSLRPAQEVDRDFCRRVHHSAYHDVVLRQFGKWDESQQDEFFAETWGELKFDIIEVDRAPAGCFCCEAQQHVIHLLEIAILPEFQGRGIGGELIRRKQHEAEKLGFPICLHVLKESDAKRLYQRLGFQKVDEDATHLIMEWR
ncbi:MAG: GNAT family N-acetyltransferase [Armatimonadota bacterium]